MIPVPVVVEKNIKNVMARRNYKAIQIPSVSAPFCVALEKSVGALIFREKEGTIEYLVMQYPHGHWEFPRGHVEGDETDEETMYREVEEETGISVTQLELQEGFRATMTFWYVARGNEREQRIAEKKCLTIRKKVIFFLACMDGGAIALSHEHDDYLWLTFDDAMKKLTYDNARRMITQAQTFLDNKK